MKPPILLPAVLLASLTGPAAAQIDLEWSEGILGGYWRHELTWPAPGAPQLWFLIPSFNSGPTPLAAIDPGNPAVLNVGVDLLGLVASGPVVGMSAQTAFPLPAVPALAGQTLHAQALTLPGQSFLVDDISKAVRMKVTAQGDTWIVPGSVGAPRRHHTLTLLADGRVAVLGGVSPAGAGVAGAELYNPQVQGFVDGGSIGSPRSRHTATPLPGGKILLAGGLDAAGTPLSTCVVYDPQTGTTTPTGNMARKRVLHAAVALPGGRVLVAGGSAQFTAGDPIGFPASLEGVLVDELELYDPVAGTWSTVASFPTPRTGLCATLQDDGTVLLTGGVEKTGPTTSQTTATTFEFDPAGNGLSPDIPLPSPLALHQQILTADGETLVMGGGSFSFAPAGFTGSTASVRMGSGDGNWTAGPSTTGIVACGDLICIPRPTDIPIIVAGSGDALFEWTGREVVYFAGGGVSDINFAGGSTTVTTNQGYHRTFEDFAAWDVPATTLLDRPGARTIPTDGGRRILTIGAPASAPVAQLTAEALTLP